MHSTYVAVLKEAGYFLSTSCFTKKEVDSILIGLNSAFLADREGNTLRCEDGSIYGARNLLRLWPAVAEIWKKAPLPELVQSILGPEAGLVRILYFDKPPMQSWALPWHKDRTIAVQNNRLPSSHFKKPTTKVGIPHVEAPDWLLEKMLTLRLHLDEVTDENGPLKVLIGSQKSASASTIATIHAQPGDVLFMRPLLSHCSNKSIEGTHRQRRILHFEFAGVTTLPDRFAWHEFIPIGSRNAKCETKITIQ